jgi:hypothetical protein
MVVRTKTFDTRTDVPYDPGRLMANDCWQRTRADA